MGPWEQCTCNHTTTRIVWEIQGINLNIICLFDINVGFYRCGLNNDLKGSPQPEAKPRAVVSFPAHWWARTDLNRSIRGISSYRDAIWRHKTWWTLVQIKFCCLTAPSHYTNQFTYHWWYLVVFTYGNFTGIFEISTLDVNLKSSNNVITAFSSDDKLRIVLHINLGSVHS